LGFCALLLVGAGAGLNGCADEYAGGYRGGYYASYPGYRPYYGGYGYYGYAPYRYYGPYYGSPYPSYGGGSVVISGSRSYTYRNGYRRTQRRSSDRTRSRRVTRPAVNRSAPVRSENDDERRYYTPR